LVDGCQSHCTKEQTNDGTLPCRAFPHLNATYLHQRQLLRAKRRPSRLTSRLESREPERPPYETWFEKFELGLVHEAYADARLAADLIRQVGYRGRVVRGHGLAEELGSDSDRQGDEKHDRPHTVVLWL